MCVLDALWTPCMLTISDGSNPFVLFSPSGPPHADPKACVGHRVQGDTICVIYSDPGIEAPSIRGLSRKRRPSRPSAQSQVRCQGTPGTNSADSWASTNGRWE